MLNFINQRAYFQRISYNFNEVLISISLQKYFFSLKNSYQITKNAQQKALPPERETGFVFFSAAVYISTRNLKQRVAS